MTYLQEEQKNLIDSLNHALTNGIAHRMAIEKYDIPRPNFLGGGFDEKY